MEAILRDLQLRLANVVRRGVIHSVVVGNPVRVRVRLGEIVSPLLPWCQTQAGANVQVSNPPAVGDAVTLLCESGELRNGRVYPGANIDAVPVPAGKDSEHVTRYGDGTEVRYDRDTHALSIILTDGGTWTIKGEGTLDGNVRITQGLQVGEDINAGGEVADKTGTMSAIRETYNDHNHHENGDGGGVTDPPENKM